MRFNRFTYSAFLVARACAIFDAAAAFELCFAAVVMTQPFSLMAAPASGVRNVALDKGAAKFLAR